MKETYKYVFVVLTYRKAEDLYDFDKSAKEIFSDYHIIVVNSYFDDKTEERIRNIAEDISGTFFSVENKGYGAGNNAGIEFAMKNCSFEYLIVANADLVFRSFDDKNLPKKNAIIGPALTTIKGKAQNPYWDKERNGIEKIIYKGHKKKSRICMYWGQGVNRLFRELFLKKSSHSEFPVKVYAVHGACVIFTKDAIARLFPVYDTNMFLFYEEAYLAKKASRSGIEVVYYPLLDVLHKEDGSTKGLNLDLSEYATNSYLYYYENFCKEGISRKDTL